MKSTYRRWLPALTRKDSAVLGLAALAVAAGMVGLAGSPAAAAVTAPETAAAAAGASGAEAKVAGLPGKKEKDPKKEPAKAPAAKSLRHSFQLQSTFYFCGPAATRVALSAHGKVYSQGRVADLLGTTVDGTNSAHDITRVLNRELGKNRYHTVEISGRTASSAQVAQLRTDIMTAINRGDPVVANVSGTITDDNGDTHSFPGHYVPVVGYGDNGNTVTIADSADTDGSAYYTVSTRKLANWIATRGYSA